MTEDPTGYDEAGDPVVWRVFFDEANQRLGAAGFADAGIDARRLVEHASGIEPSAFHVELDSFATKRGVVAFDAMLARRLTGEPLQYVVGSWSFRNLDLMVDERVLIPRPETETVTQVVLDELDRQTDVSPLLVADLGTGSGAIGLAVASERVDTQVTLTDISADALRVARANLAGIGRAATRVGVAEGSWFDALPAGWRGEVAVLVSNPPYVAAGDELPAVVRDWEPTQALVSGATGTEAVEALIDGAHSWLRPGGAVVLEMAPHQTDQMAALAVDRGYTDVAVVADMAGRARTVRARRETT